MYETKRSDNQIKTKTKPMSAITENKNGLVSVLERKDECKYVYQDEDRDELYVRFNNPDSNVQLYSTTLKTIEQHNYEIRYISVLTGYDKPQIRVKLIPQ